MRVVARGLTQGALDAEIEHPGIGQPAGAGAEEIGGTGHRVPVDPRRIDRGLAGGREGVRSASRGGTGDEETRASPRDDRAFRRKPLVRLDHRRFRHSELGRELAHRGQPRAAGQRARRDAVADVRGRALDA